MILQSCGWLKPTPSPIPIPIPIPIPVPGPEPAPHPRPRFGLVSREVARETLDRTRQSAELFADARVISDLRDPNAVREMMEDTRSFAHLRFVYFRNLVVKEWLEELRGVMITNFRK